MFATIFKVDADWGERVPIDTTGNEILWGLGRTDLAPAAGTKIFVHKYMFTNTCAQIHCTQIQVYIRRSNLYQDQTITKLERGYPLKNLILRQEME